MESRAKLRYNRNKLYEMKTEPRLFWVRSSVGSTREANAEAERRVHPLHRINRGIIKFH
jgi:hypothetical protein